MRSKPPLSLSGLVMLVAATAGHQALAGIAPTGIDLFPTTLVVEDFNDGVDTATAFGGGVTSAGESAGVATVVVPPVSADPQVQYPAPATVSPFDVGDYPFLRVGTRATGPAPGDAQIFPLPPDGATALTYPNPLDAFAERQLTFVDGSEDGTGFRIDPTPGGNGTSPATFDYDYLHIDQVPTISLGEFDRTGGTDGWVLNPQVSGAASAITSAIELTPSGNDPILSKAGLAVDTSIYDVIEILLKVEPESTNRFEIFWGTDLHPGPAGGQSAVINEELIRDGEFHVYRMDMAAVEGPGFDFNWEGTLTNLRIDPVADEDGTAGRKASIGYIRLVASPGIVDSDGDTLPDIVETDNGVLSFAGPRDTGTDPTVADSDGDGFDDGVELGAGTDPTDVDAFPVNDLVGYSSPVGSYVINQPITPNAPIRTGVQPDRYTVDPPLPDGLELDGITGVISGTPQTLSGLATYTVTADFDTTFDTEEVAIEILPPRLELYPANPVVYDTSAPIPPNVPVFLGDMPSSFSISPQLPAGLNFDSVTGAISGIPTEASAETVYTVTASYGGTYPESSVELSLAVELAPMLFIDPVLAITDFVSLGEFETPDDVEGWVPTKAVAIADAGVLAVTALPADPNDPQIARTDLSLTPENGSLDIIEIRARTFSDIRLQVFWADGSGGFSETNSYLIPNTSIFNDGEFHVYQIQLNGEFVGTVDALRLDPGDLPDDQFEIDYIRVGNFQLPQPVEIVSLGRNFLDEFEIVWETRPGEAYDVLSSDGLAAGSFTPQQTGLTPAVGQSTLTYSDTTSAGQPSRFYRIVTRLVP